MGNGVQSYTPVSSCVSGRTCCAGGLSGQFPWTGEAAPTAECSASGDTCLQLACVCVCDTTRDGVTHTHTHTGALCGAASGPAKKAGARVSHRNFPSASENAARCISPIGGRRNLPTKKSYVNSRKFLRVPENSASTFASAAILSVRIWAGATSPNATSSIRHFPLRLAAESWAVDETLSPNTMKYHSTSTSSKPAFTYPLASPHIVLRLMHQVENMVWIPVTWLAFTHERKQLTHARVCRGQRDRRPSLMLFSRRSSRCTIPGSLS